MQSVQLSSHINPPGSVLGTINAVIGGRGRHVVEKFKGPLSIKFMMRGAGLWRTPDRFYRIEEGQFLVLNAGQTYALRFPGDEPHESFCPFFRDGFVEDAAHATTCADDTLLDEPEMAGALEFPEHLHVGSSRVIWELVRLRDTTASTAAAVDDLEDCFRSLAAALIHHLGRDIARERARLPAVKQSTRSECHRRLLRARDFIHAYGCEPLNLNRIAKEAALSPHHLHRLFRAAFGEPPHRYIVKLRLARAARLLLRTDLPMTVIAAKSGFESLAGFSTRFSRDFGSSPSAFRAAKKRAEEEPGR